MNWKERFKSDTDVPIQDHAIVLCLLGGCLNVVTDGWIYNYLNLWTGVQRMSNPDFYYSEV